MTRPEEALERAREAAARSEVSEPPPAFEVTPGGGSSFDQLSEWAVIDPQQARVYSTRRFGAPITWAKRGLLRLLRQHTEEVTAQQTRFNAHVAAALVTLDARVRALEERARPEAER